MFLPLMLIQGYSQITVKVCMKSLYFYYLHHKCAFKMIVSILSQLSFKCFLMFIQLEYPLYFKLLHFIPVFEIHTRILTHALKQANKTDAYKTE